jgi:hypothetical protein
MVVSSANIAGLDATGIQISGGSSVPFNSESSGVVNPQRVGELQFLSESQPVFSPGTSQPTTDSGSRGMGGLEIADGQTENSLDPMLESPASSVPETANNPEELLNRNPIGEDTSSFSVPSVFGHEPTAQPPMTIWNQPLDHIFDESNSLLSSGELAPVHAMTDGPTIPAVDFHFPGAMIMLLSLGSRLELASQDKQAGLTALPHWGKRRFPRLNRL